MRTLTATVGSATLPIDLHDGDSGRTPLLLLHAGVADRRAWSPLVDHLAGSRRCVTYDARGYGDSSYDPEPHSPVADALAVLDAVGVDRAVLVGNSVGGRTALTLALDHPDRVAAVVLIAAPVTGSPDELDADPADVEAAWARIQAADEAGDLAAVNAGEARFWLDGPTSPEGRVRDPARRLFLDMNARALAAPDTGADDLGAPAWPRLADLSVPTLVLVGALDLPSCGAVARASAERVPGAAYAEIAGVAHLPVLESDAATLVTIGDFVAAH